MTQKKLIILIICILVILLIIKIIYSMSNILDTQTSLRRWLTLIESASLLAVALTIIFGGAALIIRKRLDDIEQKEKRKFELEIQQTKAKADSATGIAEEARLKQKEAELETKKIELELERLKISVMDRVLPSDKIPLFSEKLKKRSGENISIWSLSTDIEAVNYMNQLASLFKSCGWIVKVSTPILYGGPIPPGITISISNTKFVSRAEDVIYIFNELGFNPNYYLVNSLDCELEIIVGPKERKPLK